MKQWTTEEERENWENMEKEVKKIMDELSKDRKEHGENSYETDGVIEKVTTNGYTVWQPHGTHDRVMKEMIAEEIDKFSIDNQKNTLEPTFKLSRIERRKEKRK